MALAAALVEVGVRLQGLGGRAAPPTPLLMGDLCLARGSRLLADHAPLAVQVAFARAIESLSTAAASSQPAPHVRRLLQPALAAPCCPAPPTSPPAPPPPPPTPP